jgi:hypothetical protein
MYATFPNPLGSHNKLPFKGIVQLEKTGVKAGINISTSNNFFSLFCPLGSDREVTEVISVHAQYRCTCNEPFIAIFYEPMVYCTCMYTARA